MWQTVEPACQLSGVPHWGDRNYQVLELWWHKLDPPQQSGLLHLLKERKGHLWICYYSFNWYIQVNTIFFRQRSLTKRSLKVTNRYYFFIIWLSPPGYLTYFMVRQIIGLPYRVRKGHFRISVSLIKVSKGHLFVTIGLLRIGKGQ